MKTLLSFINFKRAACTAILERKCKTLSMSHKTILRRSHDVVIIVFEMNCHLRTHDSRFTRASKSHFLLIEHKKFDSSHNIIYISRLQLISIKFIKSRLFSLCRVSIIETSSRQLIIVPERSP